MALKVSLRPNPICDREFISTHQYSVKHQYPGCAFMEHTLLFTFYKMNVVKNFFQNQSDNVY